MALQANPLAVYSNELHWVADADSSAPVTQTYANKALTVIEGRFNRIAQCIAEYWGSPTFDSYMGKLLIDERGGRQGFPPEVAEALLHLSRLHGEKFGFGTSDDIWRSASDQKHG